MSAAGSSSGTAASWSHTAQEIAQALGKAKRSGREWLAVCPCHNDRNPSLSIAEKDGTILVKCRAGCDQREVLKALRARGFGPERTDHQAKGPNGEGHNKEEWIPLIPPPATAGPPPDYMLAGYTSPDGKYRKFDDLHRYTSLNDNETHFVGRIEARGDESKVFVPITYGVFKGKRGWKNKAPLPPRPLYGLNKLTAMPDAVVILCEGEKSADAAQRQFPEYACLSWFGGTGQVDQADVAPLATRSVILWPDADEAGLNASRKLLSRLSAETRLLHVDDLPEGFDAAHLEKQHIEDPEAWLIARLKVTPKQPEGALDPGLTSTLLSARTLLQLKLEPPEALLGSLITRSTRAFLVGPTGCGKTMLGYSMGAGMGAGTGFLHWRSARQCRVLVIDGEMPGDLVQARLHDALRRAGLSEAPEGLFFYSLDLCELFAKEYRPLAEIAPLCSDEGQRFVMALAEALKPLDAIIFDNVMALLGTAALEPEKWEATLPLVAALTANRIGQLWLDHTNKAGLQYGTGTKSWRFDTVGLMLPLEDEDRRGDDIAFTLSFENPGKARRRTPENHAEYERVVIRLRDDVWTSEPATGPRKLIKVAPSRETFHKALMDAIAHASVRPGETTLTAWLSECIRRGLIEKADKDEAHQARDRRLRDFRRAKSELLTAGWIGIDDLRVIDLTRSYHA